MASPPAAAGSDLAPAARSSTFAARVGIELYRIERVRAGRTARVCAIYPRKDPGLRHAATRACAGGAARGGLSCLNNKGVVLELVELSTTMCGGGHDLWSVVTMLILDSAELI